MPVLFVFYTIRGWFILLAIRSLLGLEEEIERELAMISAGHPPTRGLKYRRLEELLVECRDVQSKAFNSL